MKTNKKSFISLLVALLLVPTLLIIGKPSVANAATSNPVELYYNDPSYIYHGTYNTGIYIKVANLGSNKKVVVHATASSYNGVWYDTEAKYVSTLSDGSQIYKAEIGYSGEIEYAIKYEVDGKTYWNNNNGKNFTSSSAGVAPVHALRRVHALNTIGVRLQNYAYVKDVKVRYTTDNWATYKDANLAYSNTYDDGTEYWAVTLDSSVKFDSNFKYAISYTVNGVTYWDNNFGLNYDSSYYHPYL